MDRILTIPVSQPSPLTPAYSVERCDGCIPDKAKLSLASAQTRAQVLARRMATVNRVSLVRMKASNKSAKSNVEVPRETIEQVLGHCDETWKLIVALSRYGGMRCPSEVLSLRWADIDWERGRMAVREPKVEHHKGRGLRSCPIFPELRPYLEKAREAAPEDAEYVIGHAEYRRAANSPVGWRNANLRTQFARILERAKVKPWPRLFQSMRASRQTELESQFPLHVVCSWLGNSPRIAQRNYLLVTDEHFSTALEADTAPKKAAQKAAQLGSKTAQKAAQQAHARPRKHSQESAKNAGKTAIFPAKLENMERRGQDSNLRKGVTPSPI